MLSYTTEKRRCRMLKLCVNPRCRCARLCCCPCLRCLCPWPVRRTARRWTPTSSSWPCPTTPCSWPWSLDRRGDHSRCVPPNVAPSRHVVTHFFLLLYLGIRNTWRATAVSDPPGCGRVQIPWAQQASHRERHRSRHLWPLQDEPEGCFRLPECEGHLSRPVLCER